MAPSSNASTANTEEPVVVNKDVEMSEAEGEDNSKPKELPEILSSEVGTTCEIKALDERQNEHGEPKLIEREDFYTSTSKKPFYNKFALVTKRIFDNDKKLSKKTLQINSPQLRKIIKEVVKYYPSQPSSFDEPLLLEAPFQLLAHFHKEILEYETDDEETMAHQKLLKDFIEIEMGDDLRESEKLIKAGFITFPLLYTIFKPGELMYTSENGHGWLLKLHKTVYGEDKYKQKHLEMEFAYTAYNGKYAGRATHQFLVIEKKHVPGPTEISSLPFLPAKFLGTDMDFFQEMLRERGERYLQLKGVQVVQYDGLFRWLKTPPSDYYNECSEMAGIWMPETVSVCS